MSATTSEPALTTASVLVDMQRRLDSLPQGRESMAEFLRTYRRTTAAVARAARASLFEDPEWVEALVVAFAELYLDALDAGLSDTDAAPEPWRLAFDAPPSSHPVVHVLLGINAHINNDLPRALLTVIPDEDFEDPVLVARRRRDHERIDDVLRSRVAAEDHHLTEGSQRTLLDRALSPLHRWGSQRLLRGARQDVWHNTLTLQRARLADPDTLTVRLAELEALSAARVADLRRPRQALLRLSLSGFGVTLAPVGDEPTHTAARLSGIPDTLARMPFPHDPAGRHRAIAGIFTERVRAVDDWDAPAPVDGWAARDVVRHLVEWFPSFLEAGAGVTLASGPSADEDPVAAWTTHADAVQELLDDPDTATKVLSNPHIGDIPLPQAVDQFYVSDIFLHTWDLARATGQPDRLDEEFANQMFSGMQEHDEMLRASGQYGPRVDVLETADITDKLVGFIGRDPSWTPPA